MWHRDLSQAEAREEAQAHSVRRLSKKEAAKLLLADLARLKEKGTSDLVQLRAWEEEVESAYDLTQAFKKLIHERTGRAGLEEWVRAVRASGIGKQVRFAEGLQMDELAVVAGVTLPNLNGQVEVQVNRLKLIKKEYVRAGQF